MTELDLEDDTLGGIVAWYSTVHTPPELLPTVFAECHRVLAPCGHELSLDVYWMSPDHVADLMSKASLVMDAQMIREPDESEKPRQGQQAFFLAHKPKGS